MGNIGREPAVSLTRRRGGKRFVVPVLVGRIAILLGAALISALTHKNPVAATPRMADPAATHRQVMHSIEADFCGGTYATSGQGLGDYGDYGRGGIDCQGPSGGDVAFGIFADQTSIDAAASAFMAAA